MKDIGLYAPLRNTEQTETLEENYEKRKLKAKEKAKPKKKKIKTKASYDEEFDSSNDDNEENYISDDGEDSDADNGKQLTCII